MKWNLIEIENEIWIPFKWRDETQNGYGVAEFRVCLKLDEKKSEFWVYPLQQHDVKDCWHLTNCHHQFYIASYQGLDNPRAWLFDWCKDHKTQSTRIYAPNEAKYVHLDFYGISFLREKCGDVGGEQ